MKQLATIAGVGVGTAYRHFASVEELADAAATEHLARLETTLTAPPEDPWDAISIAGHRSLDLMLENHEVAPHLLFGETPTASSARMRVHDSVARLVSSALPELASDTADDLAADLQNLICAIAMAAGASSGSPQSAHRQLDLLLLGLHQMPTTQNDARHLG